ncbi:MAG TPA: S41 family peptidase [Puia sp.]|nr:S41 family peptidase [Puia sp.]
MSFRSFLATCLSLGLCLSNLGAQPLTRDAKISVINHLSQSLLDNYVFADTARLMKVALQKNLSAGLYDSITNPAAFAQKLTRDLRSVYKDLHLGVRFDPQQEKNLLDTSRVNEAADRARNLARQKAQNFGFNKVEILNGNIGYVRFDRFASPNEEARATVGNVFGFLKNTTALIFDVRDNGGGDPEMVRYICNYLFDKPTHINDLYERRKNSTQAFWTEQVKGSETFSKLPVYVLTSDHTFSGAEEFAYDIKCQQRGEIIGETTGGGAHPVQPQPITNGFVGFIPFARAINPITKTNWEAVGVKPDLAVASDKALDEAMLACYDKQLATTSDSNKIKPVQWSRNILYAKIHPYYVDTVNLKSYVGKYGDGRFEYRDGGLYFTGRSGRVSRLVALSERTFKPQDIDYFKLEFKQDAAGKVIKVLFTFDDGYTELHMRE